MKIIERNLKQFIEVPSNTLELTNSYITEVESFSQLTNINNLVIGHVLEKEKHENADTLSVLKVDLGTHVEQIVCGASNVDVGQYVIIATVGAILPGDFLIKKSKIRSVESNGMVCSLKELGIEESSIPEAFKNGIYYFDEPKEIGSNALIHLGLDGFALELSLTPNRSDLLSHYGYAKDLAAVLNKEITLPNFDIKYSTNNNPLTVEIESTKTNYYSATYLENIKIQESPIWLKAFLKSLNCQPINNVVDITNYILYTYGIPMHAFDSAMFTNNKIVVKDNFVKTDIVTLDGGKYTLNNDEIVITNGSDIVALGGVMGLENSMITNNTTKMILEVASFDKQTTANTSKKLNLKSDSSLRYERGIDEQIITQARNHALYLLQTLANATIYSGISEVEVRKYANEFIEINTQIINKKIGQTLENDEIISILKRLNYEIKESKTANIYLVKAPTYRHDIHIADDVLEEVVRIYGMDQVKTSPLLVTGLGSLTKKQKTVRTLRHYLSSLGLNEVVTYSLMKEDYANKYNQIGELISVLKPQTTDRKTLRQSLINGLVDTTIYNNNRSIAKVNIFEIGHVYAKGIEDNMLAFSLTSRLTSNSWKKDETPIDFYYTSGILSNIMKLLNVEYELETSNNLQLHPYQSANVIVNKEVVGVIGKIHPKNSSKSIFVVELNLDKIVKKNKFKYETISKYPNVERDIAIVLSEEVELKEVIRLIKQTAKNQLVKYEVFDIYQGSHIENGYKSVGVKMVFNDKSKTLEGSDVDKLVNKIVKRIEFELSGQIRS